MTLQKYRTDRAVPDVTPAPIPVRFVGHIVDKMDDKKTVIAQIEIPGMSGVQRAEIELLRVKYARVNENDVVAGTAYISKFYSDRVNSMVTSIETKNVVIRNASGMQVA